MTIIAVNFWANIQGGVNAEGVQTYTNIYEVLTDDKDDTSDTVRGPTAVALGLPDYNDGWTTVPGGDSNPFALAKVRNAEIRDPRETRRLWAVTIEYTTAGQSRDPAGATGNREGVQNPIDEPAKYSGSFAQTQERTSKNKDGKRIINSAEETRIVSIPGGYDTFVITKNTATIDLSVRADAVTKVNSIAMWGLETRRVYLAQWSWNILYRGLTPYIAHRLEWWFAKPGPEGSPPVGLPNAQYLLNADGRWNTRFLDRGTRQVADFALVSNDPDNPRYEIFDDGNDNPTEKNLDGLGRELEVKANPFGIYLSYKVIEEFDFLTNIDFLEDPLTGPFV